MAFMALLYVLVEDAVELPALRGALQAEDRCAVVTFDMNINPPRLFRLKLVRISARKVLLGLRPRIARARAQ